MVIAGPGTGKTQVLSLRVANLLAQGIAEPENILALTFTKSAATNMRARLARLIGPVAMRVNFHTFHSFCQEVMTDNPEFFGWRREALPVDELEKMSLLESIIDNLSLDVLRPANAKYYYIPTLCRVLDTLKRENVDVEAYEQLLAAARVQTQQEIEAEQAKKRPSKTKINKWEKTLAKQEELALIYREYQAQLERRGRYDFSDMILQVLSVWRQETDFLAACQEKYQYLLVDEYQDTNNAQDEIVRLLASYWGEQANVFVVGDPQQAIYRFQGANLENFLGFVHRYPQAQQIVLTTGYRCSDKTYQLAAALMSDKQAQEWVLPALRNSEGRIGNAAQLSEATTRETELWQIAKQMQAYHQQGMVWSEMAVIYRKNSEAAAIMSVLAAAGVPYKIEGGRDILTSAVVQQVLQLVELLTVLDKSAPAEALLYSILWWPSWSWQRLAVLRWQQACQQAQVKMIEAIVDKKAAVWEQLLMDEQLVADYRQLQWLGEQLLVWRQALLTQPVPEVIQKIITESHLLAWIQQQTDSWQQLLDLYTWQRQVMAWWRQEPELTGEQLLAKVATMREQGLGLPALDVQAGSEAVTLTTAHKAKGQEWQEVFVCGLNRGVWDQKSKRDLLPLPAGILKEQTMGDVQDEERRLLFVALTRAKGNNHLSWHRSDESEGQQQVTEPADFVYELEEQTDLVCKKVSDMDERDLSEQMSSLLQPAVMRDWSVAERAWAQQRVSELVLSVTMLNTYLKDSHEFVQRYILQAPDYQESAPLAFGQAIHRALETAVRAGIQTGSWPTVSQVEENFEKLLAGKNIPKSDMSVWEKLGKQSLLAYYPKIDRTQPLLVERNFGVHPKLVYCGVPVTGKIDRVDWVNKGVGLVRVIDYKTGRVLGPKLLSGESKSLQLSERELSLPQAVRSPYKRQLLFYKLLCQLDKDFPYQVDSGCLDFVKTDGKKPPVRRELALPDEEVELLGEVLVQVWQEIQELKFLEDV